MYPSCNLLDRTAYMYFRLAAWPKMEESEKRKYVQVLLDKLDKSSREERLQAARQVVFIALGTNA